MKRIGPKGSYEFERITWDQAYETIIAKHTENSRKFTAESIKDLAARAGLSIENWYSDPAGWFSLVVMMRSPHGTS
jgi:anaerobic selenocysteine-containing dehydrogenase